MATFPSTPARVQGNTLGTGTQDVPVFSTTIIPPLGAPSASYPPPPPGLSGGAPPLPGIHQSTAPTPPSFPSSTYPAYPGYNFYQGYAPPTLPGMGVHEPFNPYGYYPYMYGAPPAPAFPPPAAATVAPEGQENLTNALLEKISELQEQMRQMEDRYQADINARRENDSGSIRGRDQRAAQSDQRDLAPPNPGGIRGQDPPEGHSEQRDQAAPNPAASGQSKNKGSGQSRNRGSRREKTRALLDEPNKQKGQISESSATADSPRPKRKERKSVESDLDDRIRAALNRLQPRVSMFDTQEHDDSPLAA